MLEASYWAVLVIWGTHILKVELFATWAGLCLGCKLQTSMLAFSLVRWMLLSLTKGLHHLTIFMCILLVILLFADYYWGIIGLFLFPVFSEKGMLLLIFSSSMVPSRDLTRVFHSPREGIIIF